MKHFRKIQIAFVRVLSIAAAIMTLGCYSSTLYAADELNTFSPGQTISSSQVNANFQALSEKIAAQQTQLEALQAKLATVPPISPASVAGIYDYFLFTTGMDIVSYNSYDHGYRSSRTSYQGTIVLSANSTAKISGTGAKTRMEIRSVVYNPPNLLTGVSGTLSEDSPPDAAEMAYSVAGSTITVGGGVFVGTLSSDGKIFAGISRSDHGKGLMIGIRRPPAITNATSTTADGRYSAGASINITLTFNEAVTSAGLTIALNSGGTITTGAISNAPSWSGLYTPLAGQTSGDLSINTIAGFITSGLSSFNTINPAIPAGHNIGDSKAIVIE